MALENDDSGYGQWGQVHTSVIVLSREDDLAGAVLAEYVRESTSGVGTIVVVMTGCIARASE